MIAVTRLNNSQLVINALLIETVESTPDTVISLTTGKKIMVLESVSDVVSLTQNYLRSIGIGFAAAVKQTEGQDHV
ncbi:flagellar protein D [Paenibacillus swuensis]|uniref:Flagellar protein D n=1 Tax=Paenibacillus swuensis TaxID=1178515 RepID=A0A172TKG2_9BACL|nr:flagellar FlbD family protein [Paenibacillus swuensis]ANE47545.1 flagellar protein D [Paenibacillus swuensis]